MDTSAFPSARSAAPTLREAAPWVLAFEQVRAHDIARVGGKGANLGELVAAGFPVPPGFCITTAAYTRFLEAFGDTSWLWEQLDGLDPHDLPRVQAAGARVRERLLEVPIPTELVAAIVSAWEAAGTEHAYAVRSSATAEDLPGASFAGQQETYLNIRGEEALLSAVRACWASLFTDRAILYRIQNGFSHRAVLLSVVVQRMVLPEVSGLLFTADPVSGHRHRLVIEASFGLGEALVSGLVTPDRYQLDKRNPDALEVFVADKQRAIRPLPEGGTREEPLTGALCHARVLQDEQIRALAQLGIAIERHYGAPQDIEWCFSGETFYIVQSRPITSLYPLPAPAPDDEHLHLYLCLNHLQVMTDPMPPLAHSLWRYFFPFGKGKDFSAPNPYILEAGGSTSILPRFCFIPFWESVCRAFCRWQMPSPLASSGRQPRGRASRRGQKIRISRPARAPSCSGWCPSGGGYSVGCCFAALRRGSPGWSLSSSRACGRPPSGSPQRLRGRRGCGAPLKRCWG